MLKNAFPINISDSFSTFYEVLRIPESNSIGSLVLYSLFKVSLNILLAISYQLFPQIASHLYRFWVHTISESWQQSDQVSCEAGRKSFPSKYETGDSHCVPFSDILLMHEMFITLTIFLKYPSQILEFFNLSNFQTSV